MNKWGGRPLERNGWGHWGKTIITMQLMTTRIKGKHDNKEVWSSLTKSGWKCFSIASTLRISKITSLTQIGTILKLRQLEQLWNIYHLPVNPNSCSSSANSDWYKLTLKALVATIDAQWEGMGDVGSARYEPALLPPCPTIRVLSYSN